MRPLGLVLLAALSACNAAPPLGTSPTGPSARAPDLSPWSRDAFPSRSNTPDTEVPPELATADPNALAELLAAAPKPSSEPEAQKSRLGSDTKLPEAPPSEPEAKHEKVFKPRVSVERGTIDVPLPNPAIERTARAQLYWNLVQRCRDPQGKILPPESIRLHFKIDSDGFIIPSTILATPNDQKGESSELMEAAHCMRRELSKVTFRAPAASRGTPTPVGARVPSVD